MKTPILVLVLSFVVVPMRMAFADTLATGGIDGDPSAPRLSAITITHAPPPLVLPPGSQNDPLLKRALRTRDPVAREMIANQINGSLDLGDQQFRLLLRTRLANLPPADVEAVVVSRDDGREEPRKHRRRHHSVENNDNGNNVRQELAVMAMVMMLMNHQTMQPARLGPPWPRPYGGPINYGGLGNNYFYANGGYGPRALPMPQMSSGYGTAMGPGVLPIP